MRFGRKKPGFTLAELVMALTITAVIGTAVAGMGISLGTAYSNSQASFESVQTGRCAMLRLQDIIRNCRLVTATSTNSAVLWIADTNGDGLMNLDELAVVYYDQSGTAIKEERVRFPDEMAPATKAALNVRKTLSDVSSASAAKTMIESSAYKDCLEIATDVVSMNLSVYPATPLTALVRIQITVGSGGQRLLLSSAATIRAGAAESVTYSGGQYVLNPS